MLVQAVPTKQMLHRNGNFDWIRSQLKTFLAARGKPALAALAAAVQEGIKPHMAPMLHLLGESAGALTSYKMEQDVNSQPVLKLLKQNLPEFVW